MNAWQPGAAEDLTGAVRSLVAQALSLCAQANMGELELVEILLRDAVDVLDDSSGGAPGASSAR